MSKSSNLVLTNFWTCVFIDVIQMNLYSERVTIQLLNLEYTMKSDNTTIVKELTFIGHITTRLAVNNKIQHEHRKIIHQENQITQINIIDPTVNHPGTTIPNLNSKLIISINIQHSCRYPNLPIKQFIVKNHTQRKRKQITKKDLPIQFTI